MLLIVFVGLIATVTTVSGDCAAVTPKLNNFDWSNVGISILT
jgi:hypothetical protein